MKYQLKQKECSEWITEYCIIGNMFILNEEPKYLCNWVDKLATAKATKTRIINNLKFRAEYNKDYAAGEADTLEERIKTFRIITRKRRVELSEESFVKEK